MEQTSRPLLVHTSPLVLLLICEIAIAQQSTINGSYPFIRTKLEKQSLYGNDLILQIFNQSTNNLQKHEERLIDSASFKTNTLPTSIVYYFYEPFPLGIGSSIVQLGASFSLFPLPVAEQEIPYPAIDLQYKRGIFENISLVGSLSTNIFSNLVHAGIQWNRNSNNFSVGFANHVGLAYGFIKAAGLFDDVEAYATFYMPILRFGYRFDDFSLSCSFVTSYVFKSSSYVNGLKASVGPENSINDFFCTLAVEQPFLKDVHLSIGFSLTYSRTPYQSWMLYNTIDEWLFVPEFFFAVQL